MRRWRPITGRSNCDRHTPMPVESGQPVQQPGKPDQAIELYQRAIAAKPARRSVQQHGQRHAIQGILEETIPLYQKAISLRPDYAEAYSNLGVTLTLMGRYADAVAYYKRQCGPAGFCQGAFSSGDREPDARRFRAGLGGIRMAMADARFSQSAPLFTQPTWSGGEVPASKHNRSARRAGDRRIRSSSAGLCRWWGSEAGG